MRRQQEDQKKKLEQEKRQQEDTRKKLEAEKKMHDDKLREKQDRKRRMEEAERHRKNSTSFSTPGIARLTLNGGSTLSLGSVTHSHRPPVNNPGGSYGCAKNFNDVARGLPICPGTGKK